MAKPKIALRNRKSLTNDLFFRADRLSDQGQHRKAFRLFLSGAKAGDDSAQLNVGYCYDCGVGTRRNRSAAMYWYKRAYRRGDGSAANNIGTIWRDEHKPKRALYWFRRAVDLGNDGANVEIAKFYLGERDTARAIRHLEIALKSDRLAEVEEEEARRLLKLAGRPT